METDRTENETASAAAGRHLRVLERRHDYLAQRIRDWETLGREPNHRDRAELAALGWALAAVRSPEAARLELAIAAVVDREAAIREMLGMLSPAELERWADTFARLAKVSGDLAALLDDLVAEAEGRAR